MFVFSQQLIFGKHAPSELWVGGAARFFSSNLAPLLVSYWALFALPQTLLLLIGFFLHSLRS
jgi:hypothetical protein